MMQLIDKGQALTELSELYPDDEILPEQFKKAIDDVWEAIWSIPPIDAVEVVRCKDCFFRYNGIDDSPCDRYNMPMDLPDDFYCASGVRK